MASDRSQRAVDTLLRTDPQFAQMCEMLYGPAADPEYIWDTTFGKLAGPGPSDVSIPGSSGKQTRRRKALAVATLGAATTGTVTGGMVAGQKLARDVRGGRGIGIAAPIALGSDVLAAGELGHELRAKLSKTRVPDLVRGTLTQQRRLVRETLDVHRQPTNYVSHGRAQSSRKVNKGVEADWAGEFSKLDSDKRLALGWASMSKVNGVPVVDRQGDYIDAEDLEDVVYDYVQRSRVGGDMHDRAVGKSDGRGLWFGLYSPQRDEPRKVADLVESVVITKSKKEAMGLPEDYPEGWWVGFRYHDDQAWDDIRTGRRRGFSIHGSGLRKSVDFDDLMYGGR